MLIQSDFTGGELDPKLYGRVSIPRYQSGLQTAKNVDIMVTGGATRRAGTKFVYNAGASPLTCRQLPFVLFRTDTTPASLKGYVVEFRSDNKIRFYVDGALIVTGGTTPYEITSPFTSADLTLLKYEQFNSGLYLVHPNFPPQILTRTSDTSWTIAAMNFTFNTAQALFGSPWTSRTSAADNFWGSVTYGNGLFVSVARGTPGTGNRVMTSPDGITWTIRTSAADNYWTSVVYGNGIFVAVAESGTGNRVMTSPDGITWTIRTSAADNNWNGVAYGNGIFVAVAESGTGDRVMTSPDGITWTSRTSAADNLWDHVAYGNGLFVAVARSGTGNRVMTSPDGITWTIRTSAADNQWRGVAYGNGLFVAVAMSGTGNRVMTSPDGITWTSRTSAADYYWEDIAYGNGLFVAVSSTVTSRVMTSPDGITWTLRTSASNNSFYGITYANDLFVAVAGTGTGTRVMTASATVLAAVSTEGVTRSGAVATATTITPHGLITGSIVTMAGAVQTEYNGTVQVTVLNAYAFTYAVTGTPATPATGTITMAKVPWGTTGYPSAITFYEQRLILARTAKHPQTVWGSETNNILNFVLGVYDSSPFEFVPSAAASSINQMISTAQVILLTNDKEITMSGGSSLPLTPTNVQIKAVGRYGSKDGIRPLPIGDELVFATRSGKRVRGMAYKLVQDSYNFPNVCIMSEHLLSSGIVEMFHASEPESCVYILCVDGTIARVAYDREQEVVAFSQYVTDGLFKGICVVQEGLKDQIYVTVQRVINGTTNLYTEIFDPTLNTDSALTGTSAPAKTTWTGLSHLEGETVDVVADGVAVTATVASGQIVLATAALAVEIGLHYESEIYDLKPEVPTQDGTAQGRTSVSVSEIIIRLLASKGCVINGETIPATGAAFTGDKKVSNLGGTGQVNVKQTKPFAFTVLAIIKRITAND
jgi:hypothetical protein